MNNDVTIGIPLYRAEKYIKDCLNSALAQSYPYIDFLVVDDASDDSSVEMVLKIQAEHPRGGDIRIIRHEKNMGIGETRNHFIAETKTKYLYFLDADDIITKNAIQLLHDIAIQFQTELVFGSYKEINHTNGIKEISTEVYESVSFKSTEDFATFVYRKYGGIQAQVWNILIDLNWFRNTGLRFLPINYWEDFSLMMDISTYASRVVLLPDITYFYNRYLGSLSNHANIGDFRKEDIQKNIEAIENVKRNSNRIIKMSYLGGRMVKVMMTDFYIVCNILKNKDKIQPSFSKRELRDIMKSPLGFWETISLKNRKFENLFLYMLGVLPPSLSVGIITLLGKHKGLI